MSQTREQQRVGSIARWPGTAPCALRGAALIRGCGLDAGRWGDERSRSRGKPFFDSPREDDGREKLLRDVSVVGEGE